MITVSRILLALAIAVACIACDPGSFPISDPRSPPPAEPKGATSATPHSHGAPAPVQVDGGGAG